MYINNFELKIYLCTMKQTPIINQIYKLNYNYMYIKS